MKKKIIIAALGLLTYSCSIAAAQELHIAAGTTTLPGIISESQLPLGAVSPNGYFKGIRLAGKVKVVKSFPDIKVKVVDSFPDLKVQVVDSFPDKIGQWKFVDSFPDFTIQFVDSFPDIKIQYVKSFPGVK